MMVAEIKEQIFVLSFRIQQHAILNRHTKPFKTALTLITNFKTALNFWFLGIPQQCQPLSTSLTLMLTQKKNLENDFLSFWFKTKHTSVQELENKTRV